MGIFAFVGQCLAAKEMEGIDLDSKERLVAHRQVLKRKPMLKDVFSEFHHQFMMLDEKFFGGAQGSRIELGAGVYPVKETYHDVLATDIVPSAEHDMVLDAQDMDLDPSSVRAIYGANCFHHFPEPGKFFSELERVLRPGGGAILIEPYYGPLASVMYKHLFSVEGFDKTMDGWDTPATGPASDANQALSYVVFNRDKAQFEEKFPELELVYQKPLHNYMRYFMSGGLNFNSLLPGFLAGPLRVCEFLLRPVAGLFALHQIVVIRRKLK